MTKEEAAAKIKTLVDSAYATIGEAQKLADEHALSFEFSLGYGMGGTYAGVGSQEWVWYSSDAGCVETHGPFTQGEWYSSSARC
jgi:hypothetical protein